MKTVWQDKYLLRAGDFDRFNRIKPSAVLDLFQDAAGRHAEEIGVGFKAMSARRFLWVLTRVKFKIIAPPDRYDAVVVKTWPLPPNRLIYRREYRIEDLNGNPLIIGSSEWVVLHSEERRLLSVPDLYPFTDGFNEEMMFEGRLLKVKDFEASGDPYKLRAVWTEVDVNGHLNNTKYANYVFDALSPSREILLEGFQIDYRKEVLEGGELNIYCAESENGILAKGNNAEGETMFTCSLEFKK